MALLPPTAVLGLELPDPDTNEPYSIPLINGWFQDIDAGVGADRVRLTAVEARATAIEGRAITPTAAVAASGTAVIQSDGSVIVSNLAAGTVGVRLEGAFPSDDTIYEVHVQLDAITGATAATEIYMGFSNGATVRTNLSVRRVQYPSGAGVTVDPVENAQTNAKPVLDASSIGGGGLLVCRVARAHEAALGTVARVEWTQGASAGLNMATVSNGTAQVDDGFRFGVSDAGTITRARIWIRKAS